MNSAQAAELVACIRLLLKMYPMLDAPNTRNRCEAAADAVEYDPASKCGVGGVSCGTLCDCQCESLRASMSPCPTHCEDCGKRFEVCVCERIPEVTA